ncbi:hypothetical protein C1M51_02870 [Methylibium sp. Pch-M]|uniref:AAA family ATPase n=1 Tax=Methylibium sp. Pch-M TaxID=2082386 RepID=UPI0010133439|nr:AAA family ATPase [Methylibium sp. Pch-M]QAZ38447.1 hypothetical protein C1M51_02870 [Methylibium sp. Pch-M]
MTPTDDMTRLRIPPQSLEAEQSILGGLLLDNAAFAGIADTVASTDFYRHPHRLIFEALSAMIVAHQPADPITLYERLDAAGQAAEIGGLAYINSLSSSVSSASNIGRYAEIVRERALLRAAISAADEIATSAFKNTSVDEVLDAAKLAFGQLDLQRKPGARRVPMLGVQQLREASASVRWVVKHVLPAESIGMMFGASGTFKSFIALDCALHVVHGLPWMGRRTTQGPVLYIAAEGGTGLWKRVAAWHRSRRIQYKDAAFYVIPVAMDLGSDAWRIVEAAQAMNVTPSMVVVDTLSQTYAGEENSANEMAAYLREIGARFRQLWQCAVLLIHHTGHQATERPRGSSAIRANLDFMLGVFRDEKEMLATLTCAKQKEQDAFADATFQLTLHELGTDEDGDRVTSLVARHLSSAEEVREAMETERGAGRGGNNQLLLSLMQNGMRETELRSAFYGEVGLDTPDARRQAYTRARIWATKSGFMEVAQGVVITLKGGG